MTETQMPFGPELEVLILSAISKVPSFGPLYCQDVNPRLFTQAAHECWAKAGFALARQYGRGVSPVSIRDAAGQLIGSIGFEAVQPQDLDEVRRKVDSTALPDVQYAVTRVRDWTRRNLLLGLASQAKSLVDQDQGAYEARLSKALKFGDTTLHEEPVVSYLHSARDRIESRFLPTYDEYISTGIQRLDQMMLGGLRKGKMGVVIAPSRGGKTSLMIDMGAGALDCGKKVLHVSHEVPQKDLAARYDTRLCGIPTMHLRDHGLVVAQRMKQLYDRGGDLKIKFWPRNAANAESYRALILELKETEGWWPDLIIADYPTLWKDPPGGDDMRMKISKKFGDFFGLVRELDVAGWCGAQGNRGSFRKKRVQLDDIGECWDIIATTDVALLLGADADMESRGITNIHKGKDRDREDGQAEDFSFQRHLQRFE